MGTTTLLAALLLQAAAAPELRSIRIAVTDEKGAAVVGLVTDEVVVLENGVACDVAKVEPDRRPLSLVLLLDSSEAVGSAYRLSLVDAVAGFLARLPEGARYALWVTGDRPRRLVDFTQDRTVAGPALKRIAPQGGSTLLDALVESTRGLEQEEGRRTVVVALTGLGVEFSSRDRHQVVDEAKRSGATFMAVLFEESPAPFEVRQAYDYVLERLTRETGGVYETTLSSMGAASALQKLAGDIAGQYRVSYASGGAKAPKLDVKVARPGVRVRLGAQPGKH